MQAHESYSYREHIQNAFLERKARNPSYSLRAFASQLGVSRTALSDVLSGKRHFSTKNALKVASSLSLSPELTKDLLVEIKGADLSGAPTTSFHLVSDDTFKVISEWYHYGILNLARLKKNRSSPWWIASQLGITAIEARSGLLRLERLGFIKIEQGKLVRTVISLDTLTDIPSQALRAYHRQNLRLAEVSLERDLVERRDFTSMVFATRLERVKKAKKMIRQFRNRLTEYLECENPTEVYTLAVQLFPLTIRSKQK